MAKKAVAAPSRLVRIEVQPSREAAEATKVLMVESLGFSADGITILTCKRVKLIAQAVVGATESTFEDPADNELYVVVGAK